MPSSSKLVVWKPVMVSRGVSETSSILVCRSSRTHDRSKIDDELVNTDHGALRYC